MNDDDFPEYSSDQKIELIKIEDEIEFVKFMADNFGIKLKRKLINEVFALDGRYMMRIGIISDV